MGVITDMSQDERLEQLERRVKLLERAQKGESVMSRIIKDLIGQDCTVEIDYGEHKCRVMDADEDWVKLLVYGKKGDETLICRIEDIKRIKQS